jgi:glycosyltransferase involved in cell wall biosynthesis
VLLEAAAMERPAVTCNVTGCRSVVVHGQTGFLCKVKDAEDLALKMKAVFDLSDQERQDMGRKAREFVIKNFHKKLVIAAYLAAIRDITGES